MKVERKVVTKASNERQRESCEVFKTRGKASTYSSAASQTTIFEAQIA